MITKPPRVRSKSAPLIDHVWTNSISNNIEKVILHSKISDHFPVFALSQPSHVKPSKGTELKSSPGIFQMNRYPLFSVSYKNLHGNLFIYLETPVQVWTTFENIIQII